ncbi:MAG: hypothetical protein LUQ65_10170 [Candidatus Helarchaeota archaeon]|nr:hypothetical protein [Candidatus Helarchaeota archaeon]
MKPLKELLAEIEQKYNRNPSNWNISIGRDQHNYGNIFISNPANVWQIKIDSLFKPNPAGVGMKLGPLEDFSDLISPSSPSFGFRPLLPTHLENLQKSIVQEKPINSIIDDILSEKPVSPNQSEHQNFIVGPVMHSSFQGYVSDKQKDLDRKLKRNLDDLLHAQGLGLDYL